MQEHHKGIQRAVTQMSVILCLPNKLSVIVDEDVFSFQLLLWHYTCVRLYGLLVDTFFGSQIRAGSWASVKF